MQEVGLCAIPCVSRSLRVVVPREQDVSEHLDVAAISKNYFTHVHRAVSLDLVSCSGLPGALDTHLLAGCTVYSAVFLPAALLAAVLGLHPALCWGTQLTPLFCHWTVQLSRHHLSRVLQHPRPPRTRRARGGALGRGRAQARARGPGCAPPAAARCRSEAAPLRPAGAGLRRNPHDWCFNVWNLK